MTNRLSHRISDLLIRFITLDYFFIKKILKDNLSHDKKTGGPDSTLDLGCGTGTLAPLFPPKNYLGMDIDASAVRYAKKRFPQYQFKAEDATSLKLNRKFDLILIVGVVHHLNDKQVDMLLGRVKSHLKKEGKVILIEAIPPIFKWNILGLFLRKSDRGAFVRELRQYQRLVGREFRVLKSYTQKGGIVDYGVLVLGRPMDTT